MLTHLRSSLSMIYSTHLATELSVGIMFHSDVIILFCYFRTFLVANKYFNAYLLKIIIRHDILNPLTTALSVVMMFHSDVIIRFCCFITFLVANKYFNAYLLKIIVKHDILNPLSHGSISSNNVSQ